MKRSLALALIAVAVMSGCTRRDLKKDELSDALYKTETIPRTFAHDERLPSLGTTIGIAPATHVVIKGVIEDDYRYRVDAFGDDDELASEIVVDDARALRMAGVTSLDKANPTQRIFLQQASRYSPELGAALAKGSWVVDPKGANDLFSRSAGPARGQVGSEFAYMNESLEILKYVRRAMGEAAAVQLFNPESQDYRPKFDPFPAPEEGVRRYDLVPPALTPRDPTTAAGAAQQLPGARFFRRMAVYVREGVVTEIRERISVESMLEDPASRLAARIGDYDITLPEGTTKEQAAFLVDAINAAARRLSQPEVLPRDLRVTFTDLGEHKVVKLPAEAKTGSLKAIRNDGQILFETPG